MLHVLNGDATLALFRRSGLLGETLVWRDALLDGPARGGLWSDDDWAFRADMIAQTWGISREDYLRGVASFLARLDRGGKEALLWFEEDLFCQLPLAYLLARGERGGLAMSVICPDKPLGTHTSDALRGLYPTRRAADAPLIALAKRAWEAYGSPDPTAVQTLVDDDDAFGAWPFLRRGLQAHLARFPSKRNGLSAIEEMALAPLDSHPLPFDALYPRIQRDMRFPAYGIGDFQLAVALRGLATCREPLVTLGGPPDPQHMGSWILALTPLGRETLAGRADHATVNGPTRWLGGVELRGGAWRYDVETRRLSRG